jgi:MoaA/NifB/PqqE/SkfB family radical SAM enzyme
MGAAARQDGGVPRPDSPRAPGPRRVTFVTNPGRCNLRCRACREHSPHATARPGPGELPWALVAAVLDERRGTALAEVIPSTQGEPLLWPGLEALAARCAADGLRLNVTTNGSWPRLGAAGWAARLVPACSDVKVSWHGATAGTAEPLAGGLRFEDALEGLRALLAARDAARARGERACTVTLQVAAQEENVAELPAVVALAARLGVDRVKVNQLQVHFPALAGSDLRRAPASRARWDAAVRGMRAAAGAVRLEGAAPWGDAAPPYGACPFLGREAWILADGRFAPCPAALGGPGSGPAGDLGAVTDRPLGALWESAAYRALVDGFAARASCARCPFRRVGGA